MADLTTAREYTHALLGEHLSEGHYYHNWDHAHQMTRDALFYAVQEHICEAEARLLETAGLFHDTGFTRAYEGHEEASAQIAREALPAMGYTAEEVETVANLILATRLPQNPTSHLQEVFCDADLDHLGRDDFFEKGQLLRKELEVICGTTYTDAQWIEQQIELLESHTYFTPSARMYRDAGKAQNLQKIKSLKAP